MNLTLKMTTAQVVETSVSVIHKSPIQDLTHSDDHNVSPTYEMTPGFKCFTETYYQGAKKVSFTACHSGKL